MITLAKQGLAQEAIAQQMGVGRSTIQRWLAAGTFPERKPREQSSQFDPYLPYALKRWSEGCHTITRIYEEIKVQGYKGAYGIVRVRLAPGASSVLRRRCESISWRHLRWFPREKRRGCCFVSLKS